VEYSPFPEQPHTDTRPFSLADLSAKLNKQGFNVAPFNVCAGWPCKDEFECFLVFSFHVLMVLFCSTTVKKFLRAFINRSPGLDLFLFKNVP